MSEILLLREMIAIIGTTIAAYTDFKTGLIFDEITYPMILFGIIFNILEFDLNVFIISAIVFTAGYILYFTGKIGGGDVKLFAGLALLVPFVNGTVFILSVLAVSGFASVLFLSVYYLAKYAKKGIKLSENTQSIKKGVLFFFVLLVYFYFGLSSGLFSVTFTLFAGVPALFALVFVSLEQGIKKNFFLKKVLLKDLEEDDLIAAEFLDKKTREKVSVGFKGIIDKALEKKLAALKITEVPVYRNLPKFAPFVLAGVIVSILFPDILMQVFL